MTGRAPALPADARAAVLVAHPDDETLWCGGLLLQNPAWDVSAGTLCRGSDQDRAPKFFRALDRLGAEGAMADLDDGPGQEPLDGALVQESLLSLLPGGSWDLVLTHGPRGEYTRHMRHEEVSRAVLALWARGALEARELWLFAYEDGERAYLPKAREEAEIQLELPDEVFRIKYSLVTEVYGFGPESWEARATPRREAFRRLTSPAEAKALLESGEVIR
jgi:LmbE family N-acetylglucosaminyl deacetylase